MTRSHSQPGSEQETRKGGACACHGSCASCRGGDKVHRHGHGRAPHHAPASVHEALRRPGRPLEAGIVADMAPRLGIDLSGVRVHTDDEAARSAMDIAADAYTVGQHVVFGPGRYRPTDAAGRHLLAHELAHVGQNQASGQYGVPAGPLAISDPSDSRERAAEAHADAVHDDSAATANLPTGAQQDGPAVADTGAVAHRAPAATTAEVHRSCHDGNCETCAGGRKTMWLTAFWRVRATRRRMAEVRHEIDGAKRILGDCCIDLKVDFDWRLLPGGGTLATGNADASVGGWDYPEATEAPGESGAFASSRGMPMLIVDEVPATGGGVTVSGSVDNGYVGPDYFAIAVNQPNPNTNNTIAHELWHMAGHFNHDPSHGQIPAGTGETVSADYCAAVRGLV